MMPERRPTPTYPGPTTATAPSKTKWIAGGAVALVAAGAFALFSGGEGSLVISVAGPGGKAIQSVSVFVGEELKCSESPCVVAELPPKTHAIRATAPGFAEMAPRLVKVEKGEETPVNIELAVGAAGTGISVKSGPAGLKLSVDGKEVGPLPQELTNLSVGSHEIEISGSPYFAPFRKTISVSANEITTITPDLKLEKGQLRVELGANASGAEILLYGGKKPHKLHKLDLPQNIDIPADGSYRIVAKKSGFADFEKRIEFTADAPEMTVVVSLEEESSNDSSSDSAPSSSSSSSRGTSSGTSRGSAAAAVAPASSSSSASGQGTLNINSSPISNVILDGRPLGQTPKIGIKVKPGSHTVVFVHPQKGRKSQTVNVAAGQTAVAVARF
jgi:PEGA domain